MKVQWMPQGSLAEAVSTRIEMCLVDKNGKGLCVPVRCKDFLTDAYWSEHHNKPTSIWGFNWKPGVLDLKDKLRIAIRMGGKKLDDNNAKLMSAFLNAFMSSWGKTKVIADDAGSLFIEAPRQWHETPAWISAFTMLIRCGAAYDGKMSAEQHLHKIATSDNPLCRGDHRWVEGTLKPLTLMLNNEAPEKLAKLTYESYASAHGCHHGGGIYAAWTGKHTG